jgi:aryl-alcohol dehydrogenase-like predicted oxidoreductase
MRYRMMGRNTGLRVSEIALGTGKFGEKFGYGMSRERARQVFGAYDDAGGRFIDTAEGYQGGLSEEFVGSFVKDRRDEFVLATKFGVGVNRSESFSERGNSRKAMVRAVEGSLRRLGTDHIDLYWTHGHDAGIPVEEVVSALDSLVQSGKVLYAGLGNYPAWKISRGVTTADHRGWTPLTAVTFEYGVAERSAERELIPMAEALGVGVAAWSPLGGGYLARDDTPASPAESHLHHWSRGSRRTMTDRAVHQTVRTIAEELHVHPATVGYAWLIDRARHSTTAVVPVIGASSADQVEADLAALDLELSEGHIARLDGAGEPDLGEPHVHNRASDELLEAGPHHHAAIPAA